MIRKNFFLILALVLGVLAIAVFKAGVAYYIFLFFASISALMFVIQAMFSDFKNIINIFKGHK
jgi:hypothetical protein